MFLRPLLLSVSLLSYGSLLAEDLSFTQDIRPLLSDACFHCHGPDGQAREAKLRLDDRSAAFKAGVLTNGEMIERLLSDDPDERMPPPSSKRILRPEDRAKLVQWLKAGADWPEDDRHWAFVPPEKPLAPKVENKKWARGALDRFILARLEKEGLKPSPEADKHTLLRRVTFDLTGLPPSPEEIDAFVADESENAYEKVVDRLLASPHYGEQVASYWLDAARYADTDGYQNDRIRYMWVWRDWVIRALNDNMPFDRFILEQMAGDLLPDRNFMTQVASGYNRNHRINSEGGSIPDEWIVEYVADRVETLGTTFLGLTMNCARCHDHKYDAVSQKDFYSLFAFFNGIDEAGLGPNNGNSPPFVPVPKSWPDLKPGENKFVVPEKMKIKVVQTSVPRPQPGGANTVMVMHELPKPRPTYLLERGQYERPDKSQELQPDVPEVIGGWKKEWPKNRIGLANWLTDPEHPLTARVTVNRLWQRLFGLGLVKTSENFGVQGEHPSHPELLDWLASEFMLPVRSNAAAWSVKDTLRLLLHSDAFKRSSRPAAHQADEALLCRFPPRRVEAEVIRDGILLASGKLDAKIGGRSYRIHNVKKRYAQWEVVDNHGPQTWRRLLYQERFRRVDDQIFTAFDFPDCGQIRARRPVSTTPLQALNLLNSPFVVEQAKLIANRAKKRGGDDLSKQVNECFQLLLNRNPSAEELVSCRAVAREESLAVVCRALINSNEFVFLP